MTLGRWCAVALVVVAAWQGACSEVDDGQGAGNQNGIGTDLEADARCLECHSSLAEDWSRISSHSLVLGCTICHKVSDPSGGPGHAAVPACDECHSSVAHPSGAACARCHAVHGSPNAFLIPVQFETSDGTRVEIHVTAPDGATPDGLAHTGAEAGTGLCEVCHTRTFYYRADGLGAPHDTDYCGHCHEHAMGFAPP